VAAIPAAHEELTRNAASQHHFLGYMLSLDGAVIYHSGDCIPYAGLDQDVRAHAPDLALLPINGRGKGVAGNFTLDEAIQLSETAGIASVIAHHFGMFAFNTVDPVWARTEIAAMKPRAQVMLAETGVRYSFG
jgi:L-ascorbate metabolism protein UlaG (beta-lactamase superfamily)